ncbi:MAG: hypothetical protein ACLR78_04500 [Roseburia sp.]
MTMDGQEVFKFAAREGAGDALWSFYSGPGQKREDIEYCVLHQANERITGGSGQTSEGSPMEKLPMTTSVSLEHINGIDSVTSLDDMILRRTC